jgi:DNA-binding NtrC family response regulator
MSKSGKPRILVIDDDEGIRKVLSSALEDAGYAVDIAESGKEAIEKTKANFYNLALIDIRLGDMQGTKLLTDIKETTPKMVKIMLTGYPALQNAVDAVNKGADGYLVKPVDIDELLQMIKEHLKRQEETVQFSQEKIKDFIETRFREQEEQNPGN